MKIFKIKKAPAFVLKPVPYIPTKNVYKGKYSVVILNHTTDNVYWYGKHCSYDEAHWLGAEAIEDFAGDNIQIYLLDETATLDEFIAGYLD